MPTGKLDTYRVPSLTEADDAYAKLALRRSEFAEKQGALVMEQRNLEKEIASDTSPEVPIHVAELLGDEPGTKALNRKRLAEIRSELKNIDAAITVVDQRLKDARAAACRAVCEIVKPEYAKRVKAVVDAMRQLDAAHRHYDDLRFQLEAEDIAWGSLNPMTPNFLGGSRDPGRRIARYIQEAQDAGYAG